MRTRRTLLIAGLAALAAVALIQVLSANGQDDRGAPSRRIALFTSLPILWAESADIGGMLRGGTQPHWALETLRSAGEVAPFDTLVTESGRPALGGETLLVMAQPRALSPAENVALDDWVRGGGHVLLFADPMLTSESLFALGDPRRPQDVVMLSPILARWGLGLEFVEDQTAGEHLTDLFGAKVPVNLPGRFVLAAESQSCQIRDGGMAAQCRLGKGAVLAIADAALLEQSGAGTSGDRADILKLLLKEADR